MNDVYDRPLKRFTYVHVKYDLVGKRTQWNHDHCSAHQEYFQTVPLAQHAGSGPAITDIRTRLAPVLNNILGERIRDRELRHWMGVK